jgi:hypothetical protein
MIPSNLEKIKDPLWRIENFYKIVTKNAKLVTFSPNPIQRIINKSKAKRKIILKARQFGVTTNEMIKLLDLAVWGKNLNICILAHDQDTIKKVFKMIRIGYETMHPAIKPKLDKGGGSQYELRFPKRKNTIYVALQVRGGTNHYLHISEGAFIPIERLEATLETVPLDGYVTYESTPNGLNHYYDAWEADSNEYEKHFYPWYMHDEYKMPVSDLERTDKEIELAIKAKHYNIDITDEQLAFRRFKLADRITSKKFFAEYPEDPQSCFLSTGSNPFDIEKLKSLMIGLPKWKTDRDIKIIKPFNKHKTYVIGGDPAEGVRKDNSVGTVICVEDREQVAFFQSNQVKPSEFGDILYYMGELYAKSGKYPRIIVERNNHGHAVILRLQEPPGKKKGYPNLWMDSDGNPGHRTTTLSRPILLDTFIESVEPAESVGSGEFKINSKEIFAECLTLIDNNGKIEADQGKHDDAVIATALAIKCSIEFLPKINIYKNASTKILV